MGNLNITFGCFTKVTVNYHSFGVHSALLRSIGMTIKCDFLQSVSVTLPSGQSTPDFIGYVEVKLLAWKTVQKDLNNFDFFELTHSIEQM